MVSITATGSVRPKSPRSARAIRKPAIAPSQPRGQRDAHAESSHRLGELRGDVVAAVAAGDARSMRTIVAQVGAAVIGAHVGVVAREALEVVGRAARRSRSRAPAPSPAAGRRVIVALGRVLAAASTAQLEHMARRQREAHRVQPARACAWSRPRGRACARRRCRAGGRTRPSALEQPAPTPLPSRVAAHADQLEAQRPARRGRTRLRARARACSRRGPSRRRRRTARAAPARAARRASRRST